MPPLKIILRSPAEQFFIYSNPDGSANSICAKHKVGVLFQVVPEHDRVVLALLVDYSGEQMPHSYWLILGRRQECRMDNAVLDIAALSCII